jgi:hypothetical protein
MTEIIDAIDAWTADRYGASYTLKLFGFCELMRKTKGGKDQPMPVTMPDSSGDRVQVSLDDKYDIITWMRWEDQVRYEDNEDWSFGKNETRFANLPIRLVLAHKTTLGENFVFDFINFFPSKFTIPGFQLVFTDPVLSIDPNHENIYLTELGQAAYERHRFPWNLYVITVNAQFIICEEEDQPPIIPDPEAPEPEALYRDIPDAPAFSDTYTLLESVVGNGVTLAEINGKTDLLVGSDFIRMQINGLSATYRIKSEDPTSPSTWRQIGQVGQDYAIDCVNAVPNISYYNLILKDSSNLFKFPPDVISKNILLQNMIFLNSGFAGVLINQSVAGKHYGNLSLKNCRFIGTGGEMLYAGKTGVSVTFFLGVTDVYDCFGWNLDREGLQFNGHAMVHVEYVTIINAGLDPHVGQNNGFQLQNVYDGYMKKSIFIGVEPGMIATQNFLFEDLYIEWSDPDREIYFQDMSANGYTQFEHIGGTVTFRRCTFRNPNYTKDYIIRIQEELCNVVFEDCIFPSAAVNIWKDERSSTPYSLTETGSTFTNSPEVPEFTDPPEAEYVGYEKVLVGHYYDLGIGYRTL